MASRICVILTLEGLARSYIQTGALRKLTEDFQLVLIKSQSYSITANDSAIFNQVYEIDLQNYPNSFNTNLFFNALRWRFRKKSKTFIFRERRAYPPLSFVLQSWLLSRLDMKRKGIYTESHRNRNRSGLIKATGIQHEPLLDIISYVKKHLIRFAYILIATKPFFFFAPKLLSIEKTHLVTLENLVREGHFNLILYPSNGFGEEFFDILNISLELEIPLFLLTDNWDHLSSKAIYGWKKPQYISTWGQQSTKDAKEIHGFPEDQIFEIGGARYLNYGKTLSDQLTEQLPKNYVLFVGTILHFDEISALKMIDQDIQTNSDLYGHLKVVYRPHPYSTQAYRFNNADFKNVVLDPQFGQQQTTSLTPEAGLMVNFSLNYYPYLISHAKFLIGGLTSMLLEGSIFNKNYLALVYPEFGNLTSPHLVLTGYKHFDEIEILPNLFLCDQFEEIVSRFKELYLKPPPSPSEVANKLDYFVKSDYENYDIRLLNAVKDILGTE